MIHISRFARELRCQHCSRVQAIDRWPQRVRPRRYAMPLAAAIALLLLGSACEGDDGGAGPPQEELASPETAQEELASPETAGLLSRDDVEACLADAGLQLAAGETPVISGAEAIGINPGEGSLDPGGITTGVFVYPSEEEAAGAAESLEGSALQDRSTQEGNILVVYADPPGPNERTAIEACTSGG